MRPSPTTGKRDGGGDGDGGDSDGAVPEPMALCDGCRQLIRGPRNHWSARIAATERTDNGGARAALQRSSAASALPGESLDASLARSPVLKVRTLAIKLLVALRSVPRNTPEAANHGGDVQGRRAAARGGARAGRRSD